MIIIPRPSPILRINMEIRFPILSPLQRRQTSRNLFESREGREYIKFYRSKEEHPRYSFLADFPTTGHSTYNERFYFGRSHKTRPGLLLSALLANFNKKRIQRKIEEAMKSAPSFKYAILGAAYCLSDPLYLDKIVDSEGNISQETYEKAKRSLENFIPPHLMIDREGPRQYLQSQINFTKHDLLRRIRIHEAVTGDDILNMGRLTDLFDDQGRFSLHDSNSFLVLPTLAPLQYVLELAGLGNDEDDWSLNLSRSSVGFFFPDWEYCW